MIGLFDEKYVKMDWPGAEKRREQRQTVLKAAEIMFGEMGRMQAGLVLDESAEGVLMTLGAEVELPDQVMFRFRDADWAPAVVRWRMGTKIGLQLRGEAPPPRAELQRVNEALAVLEQSGATAALEHLRSVGFLQNNYVRKLAEDAAAGQRRLQLALEALR
jgi:hypothetical protein